MTAVTTTMMRVFVPLVVALTAVCTVDVGGGGGGDVDGGDGNGEGEGDEGEGEGEGNGDAGEGEGGGEGEGEGEGASEPPLGDLNVEWIHGAADCNTTTDPPIQVHRYDVDTFILRQSKCVNFEAPFMYLLFGDDTVLLEDTGATSSLAQFPLRTTVNDVIDDVLAERGQASIELVVVHSHAHGDHVAADGQFIGQPNTVVVGTGLADVMDFFGLAAWPEGQSEIDLGDRVVDVLPLPGHQSSHIALYDRRDGLLLTGDSLYPGHLFINDWDEYRASVARLVAYAATRPVAHVLGTHIEMTDTPAVDYQYGTEFQPDEHVLQLSFAVLVELGAALDALGATPTFEVHDDFIISP